MISQLHCYLKLNLITINTIFFCFQLWHLSHSLLSVLFVNTVPLSEQSWCTLYSTWPILMCHGFYLTNTGALSPLLLFWPSWFCPCWTSTSCIDSTPGQGPMGNVVQGGSNPPQPVTQPVAGPGPDQVMVPAAQYNSPLALYSDANVASAQQQAQMSAVEDNSSPR